MSIISGSDIARAGKAHLVNELSKKLDQQKMADSFSNLSSDINLKKVNDAVAAVDAATGKILGKVQDLALNNLSPSQVAAGIEQQSGSAWKVKLQVLPDLGGETIVFDVMPTISENISATYDSVDLIHHPGQILKYKNTNARGWGIQADLVSRTKSEASKNKRIIQILRSLVMPFYGQGTAENSLTKDRLGAPPQLVILSAYGPGMIGPVTCVLESVDWTFENEMDYIATEENEPFPVYMKLSIQLKETYTPSEFTNFDLMKYKSGDVASAFSTPRAQQTSANTKKMSRSAGANSKIDPSSAVNVARAEAALSDNKTFAMRAIDASNGVVDGNGEGIGFADGNGF